MSYLSKKIAMFLAVIMVLSSFMVAADEDIPKRRIYYKADFSGETVGSEPGAIFKYAEGGNKIAVVDIKNNSNLSVMLESFAGNNLYVENDLSETPTTSFILEASVMADNKAGSDLVCYIRSSDSKGQNLFRIKPDGSVLTEKNEKIFSVVPGKFYKIALAIDLQNSRYSLYVNCRKRMSNISLNSSIKNVKMFRFQVQNMVTDTRFYIDDINIYSGITVMTDEEREAMKNEISFDKVPSYELMQNIMSDTIGLYVGAKKAWVNGEVTYIDEEEKNAAPLIIDGVTYVPARFVAESLGASVDWIEECRKAYIDICGQNVELKPDDCNILIDGTPETISSPPLIIDSKLMLPLREMGELAGKEVFWDKTGLILMNDGDFSFFDWTEHTKAMSKIIGEMVYERPSGSELIEAVKSQNPDNGHPRILATEADFERIKAEITSGNEIYVKIYEDVKKHAEEQYAKDIVVYDDSELRSMWAVANQFFPCVETMAFMYKVTDDEKWAKRAWEHMEAVCGFKAWGPYHTLDLGEMLYGIAVGYDWLYDWMSEEQRAMVREATVKNGFSEIIRDYTLDPTRERSNPGWAVEATTNNWNMICGGGALCAALAMCDEVEDPVCERILDIGIEHIEYSFNLFAPDGAWFEGATYWEYTTRYVTNFLSSLECSTGKLYGFDNAVGLKDTTKMYFAMNAPGGSFNYHDAEASAAYTQSSAPMWFAKKYNSEYAKLRWKEIIDKGFSGRFKDLIWLPDFDADSEVTLEKDIYFRFAETAFMRGSWESDKEIYVGFHSDKINRAHSQIDAGQFIIDAMGERFAMDLGLENYDTSGGWQLYRKRAQGHNVLLINPGTEVYDQDAAANPHIDRFEYNDFSAIATTDLQCCYPTNARSYLRGINFTNNRTTVILQDELSCYNPSEVYWQMHTKANVTISDDGKTAYLKKGAAELKAEILSDIDGVFEVVPAEPLEGTAAILGTPNLGVSKLVIRLKNVTDITIAIGFTNPALGDISEEYKEIVPISEWALQEGVSESVYPDSIKINGESLTGFDGKVRFYSAKAGTRGEIPEIEVCGDGEYEVIYPQTVPGTATVIYRKNGLENRYAIALTMEPVYKSKEGIQEIQLVNVTASEVQQPQNGIENSYDNDLSTRWSCETSGCYLQADLGSVRDISHVGIATYMGSSRIYSFKIEGSEDGKNYEEIYSDQTSGESDEIQIFYIGNHKYRYVRLVGFGSNAGAWTNISEFKVYN